MLQKKWQCKDRRYPIVWNFWVNGRVGKQSNKSKRHNDDNGVRSRRLLSIDPHDMDRLFPLSISLWQWFSTF